jgi:raffinose/stachyose/melibiose transport system permease protein
MGDKRYSFQKISVIVMFLFLPLTLLAVFIYYPAFKLFELSFTDWDGIRSCYEYVGLDNYIDIFTDGESIKTFYHNIAYVVAMFVELALALYVAIIIDGKIKARNFFKSVVFMPYILNGVAVAFMFSYVYDYSNGLLNVLLESIGISPVRWLGTNYYINFSLAFISVWRFTGLNMVIFLGALQSISKEWYEASDIDGASFFQKIRFITIPSIKRVIELTLFLGINGAMRAFFEPFVITHGGPAGKSHTFVTKTLQIAFEFNNFGKASAMGVVLLIIIFTIISIQRKVLNKEGAKYGQ